MSRRSGRYELARGSGDARAGAGTPIGISRLGAAIARPYLAIISARFKTFLQYRAAAIAGAGTQLFWGFIKVMVFVAFFASTSTPQPMTFAEVVVYIWLGQALLALLPWNVDAEIADQIRTGGVAYELLRPLDLYSYWFAKTIAFRAAPTMLRLLPVLGFTYSTIQDDLANAV